MSTSPMNPHKPTWVIFDVGGVLIDFSKALQETEAYLKVAPGSFTQNILKNLEEWEVGPKHYRQIVKEALIPLNCENQVDGASTVLFNIDRAVGDTLTLIQQVHAAGYKLGMLTNTWAGIIEDVTSNLKEFELFAKVFDSAELGMRKPNEDIYIHVESALPAQGNDIFFIDDNPANIATAKARNWQTYLYSLGQDAGVNSNNRIRGRLLG